MSSEIWHRKSFKELAEHFLRACTRALRRLRSACAFVQSDQKCVHGTLWVANDSNRLQANSEDSDQPAAMLIWVFAGLILNLIANAEPRLIYDFNIINIIRHFSFWRLSMHLKTFRIITFQWLHCCFIQYSYTQVWIKMHFNLNCIFIQ